MWQFGNRRRTARSAGVAMTTSPTQLGIETSRERGPSADDPFVDPVRTSIVYHDTCARTNGRAAGPDGPSYAGQLPAGCLH